MQDTNLESIHVVKTLEGTIIVLLNDNYFSAGSREICTDGGTALLLMRKNGSYVMVAIAFGKNHTTGVAS